MRTRIPVVLVLLFILAVSIAAAQTSGATLKGQVTDSSGAVVPGVKVTIAGPGGATRSTTSGETGAFTFTNLPPGQYTVTVVATGFAGYRAKVEVGTAPARLDIGLQVAAEKQEVTVTAEGKPNVSTEASENAGSVVLRGDDLDALSDDPDDLQADLQALAGPSAGPNGGEIYVDVFSNAQLPPKASIREIRINQNPFSAEYDRLGFGRIEILTKPGSDKFHGQAFFNDSDAVFAARNPYVFTSPNFQARQYGANVGGPLNKKASFFLSAERREIDDNAIVNATILDPTTLEPTGLREMVVTPQRRTTVGPRFDYQLTPRNTLVVRYNYFRIDQQNAGIGGGDTFTLQSQAYSRLVNEHEIQVTETAMISARAVNETRFEWEHNASNMRGDSSTPALNVLGSFNGGGAQIGLSSDNENEFELQNYTTMALGPHALKFGIRIRANTVSSVEPQNFGGTFTFAGGLAPVLDANNQPVIGAGGQQQLARITSLEAYRRTLLFQSLGYTPAQIRALGGGASQFSIAAGSPSASLNQIDLAPFVQDDWRVRPNVTLSVGLRSETQTNIHDWRDFAPRFGFAWAPGSSKKGSKSRRTVIRGGFGMFYDRVNSDLTLAAMRYNGILQTQYLVNNPDFYPAIPPLAELAANAMPQTIYRKAPDIRAPYVIQFAGGIERQLTASTTVASTLTWSRADHLLLTRNINAPLTPGGPQPFGENAIYQYESAGVLKQQQWITNVNSRINRNVNLFGFYVLGYAKSNTDGVGSFPADQYDVADEWGRSRLDIRHRFVMGGSIATKFGVRLSPFITAQSGGPFNIVAGSDLNGDGLFTDRPAFATDPNKAGVVVTRWGVFDPNPLPGETIIPRNLGQSPGMYTVNLRIGKTFGFGEPRSGARGDSGGPGHGPGGGPHGRGGPGAMTMGGGGGGMHGMFSEGMTDRRFNLTVYASARNLFNHVNPGAPVGNLSSPLFGQSTNLAGTFGPGGSSSNRRIDLGLRFAF